MDNTLNDRPVRPVISTQGPKSSKYLSDVYVYAERIYDCCRRIETLAQCLRAASPETAPNYPGSYTEVWPNEPEADETLRIDVPVDARHCVEQVIEIQMRISEVELKLDTPGKDKPGEFDYDWRKRASVARFYLFREAFFLNAWACLARFNLQTQLAELGMLSPKAVKDSIPADKVAEQITALQQSLKNERIKRDTMDRRQTHALHELARMLDINPKDLYGAWRDEDA